MRARSIRCPMDCRRSTSRIRTGTATPCARARRASPRPIDSLQTLRPRRIVYARAIADRAADVAGRVAWPFWFVALFAAGVFAFAPEIRASAARAGGMIAQLRREHAWRPLVSIVIASTLLNVVGLWWGLPHGFWAGDELTPKNVASAWALHFSSGWH